MEPILSVFRSGAANIPILRSVALTQTGIGIALQRLIAAINGVKPISPADVWSVQAASRASAPLPNQFRPGRSCDVEETQEVHTKSIAGPFQHGAMIKI